jgi:hypothetical protein
MTELFTTEDVLTVFPWMSAQILHHRIKRGFLPIKHRSTIRGIPNRFTGEELVHAGVLDIQANLGALNKLDSLSQYVEDYSVHDYFRIPGTNPPRSGQGAKPQADIDRAMFPNRFEIEPIIQMYQKYEYHVIASVETYHDPSHGRLYHITYSPETFKNPATGALTDSIERALTHWRDNIEWRIRTIGFISVYQVFEAVRMTRTVEHWIAG